MTIFLLLYIAILFTLDVMFGGIILLNFFLPLIALVITTIIYIVYAIAHRDKTPTKKQGHTFINYNNETEEERKARVNKEMERIIRK